MARRPVERRPRSTPRPRSTRASCTGSARSRRRRSRASRWSSSPASRASGTRCRPSWSSGGAGGRRATASPTSAATPSPATCCAQVLLLKPRAVLFSASLTSSLGRQKPLLGSIGAIGIPVSSAARPSAATAGGRAPSAPRRTPSRSTTSSACSTSSPSGCRCRTPPPATEADVEAAWIVEYRHEITPYVVRAVAQRHLGDGERPGWWREFEEPPRPRDRLPRLRAGHRRRDDHGRGPRLDGAGAHPAWCRPPRWSPRPGGSSPCRCAGTRWPASTSPARRPRPGAAGWPGRRSGPGARGRDRVRTARRAARSRARRPGSSRASRCGRRAGRAGPAAARAPPRRRAS